MAGATSAYISGQRGKYLTAGAIERGFAMSITREALAALTPEEQIALLQALSAENDKLKKSKPAQKHVRFKMGHAPKSGPNEGKPQCYLLLGTGRSTTYIHLNAGSVLDSEGTAKARETLDAMEAQIAECRKAL